MYWSVVISLEDPVWWPKIFFSKKFGTIKKLLMTKGWKAL